MDVPGLPYAIAALDLRPHFAGLGIVSGWSARNCSEPDQLRARVLPAAQPCPG